MSCKQCGNCCRWFVVIIDAVHPSLLDSFIKQDTIKVTVNKENIDYKDTKDYYKYRGIQVIPNGDFYDLIIPNKNKDKTYYERITRKQYRVIIHCVCSKLKGNLCSIYKNRPAMCNKELRNPSQEIWVPSGCEDE